VPPSTSYETVSTSLFHPVSLEHCSVVVKANRRRTLGFELWTFETGEGKVVIVLQHKMYEGRFNVRELAEVLRCYA